MRCPDCGAEIDDDAEVCPSCGMFILDEEEPPRFRAWQIAAAVLALGGMLALLGVLF